jgi:large subunit ribosomal protein L13
MEAWRMKTHVVKAADIQRGWVHIDAEGRTLGRLATQVATILRGKDKPSFTPWLDLGDHVVVTNCSKVRITGRKLEQKQYVRYSGYPGGLKVKSMRVLFDRRPQEVVFRAVRGMMPHTKLGRAQLKKLRVYAGAEHPHQAQKPQVRSN